MTGLSAETLDALLAALEVPPGEADAPLELSSIQVVQLVDLIEATTGHVLSSREVTRANFATRAAMIAMVAALRR